MPPKQPKPQKKRLKMPKRPKTLDVETLRYISEMLAWWEQNAVDNAHSQFNSRRHPHAGNYGNAAWSYGAACGFSEARDEVDDEIYREKNVRRG